MPPAARITDMHTCPLATGPVPHVGGPILPPGCPTVLIGMLPAARMGDMATCVGPPDTIAMGSPTVLIGNMMAARLGDPTMHGGVIILGCPTVMIGEMGMGTPMAPVTPVIIKKAAAALAGASSSTETAGDSASTTTTDADAGDFQSSMSAAKQSGARYVLIGH